ncbi:MAG: hypothetical protein M1406_04260 [Nitrospirae bacterium]|nr:hypothetical protein [Nitrospirota bacterium]
MKIRIALYVFLAAVLLLNGLYVSAAHSGEAEKKSALEQNRTQIIEDIETLQQGLHKTKECVSEARTAVELERCRELNKIRRFEEVQDKLFEMGMSREERRLRKSPREY